MILVYNSLSVAPRYGKQPLNKVNRSTPNAQIKHEKMLSGIINNDYQLVAQHTQASKRSQVPYRMESRRTSWSFSHWECMYTMEECGESIVKSLLLENPKSMILTFSKSSNSKFSSLISRWVMHLLWQYFMPSNICLKILFASSSSRRLFCLDFRYPCRLGPPI